LKIQSTIVFEKNWDAIHSEDDKWQRKYRYIINTGSSRSSKTFSIIDCIDLYARANPNKRITVWRSTKKDCKDTVMMDFLKRLRSTNRFIPAQFNKTESVYQYPNGSRVEFRGTDEESVFGLTQDVAWFNEPYSISKDVFDQIDQRTSDFIFIDWNPKQNHYIDDLCEHPRAKLIHSTFMDNPFCPEEQKIKILSYQPIPTEYAQFSAYVDEELLKKDIAKVNTEDQKAIMNGWHNHRNKTANQYKWDVYGLGKKGEVEGKIFDNYQIIDEVPGGAKLYGYGLDFGYTNDPSSLIAMYLWRDGVIYHELIYSTGLKNKALADLMRKNGVGANDLVLADCSNPLIIDELFDLGFGNIHPCVKGKDSIVYGIEVMKDRPIFLTKESKNLIYEFDNYANAKDKFGKFINEPDKNQADHGIDAARYITTDKFTQQGFFVV
jgi:phage terminase large subunit